MGLTVHQVRAHSLWQFAAMADGFVDFHGGGSEDTMAEPTDDAVARYNAAKVRAAERDRKKAQSLASP